MEVKRKTYHIKNVHFLFLLYMTGTSAWAANPTITIYFGGTGVWEGWSGSASKIGAPELLTTLSKLQKTSADQHQIFIPGVGVSYTGEEDLLTMANPARPNLLPIYPGSNRGWKACMDEAETELREILIDGNRSKATLNLTGWSRGGVTAIVFAKVLARTSDLYSRIDRINILALDPVPGDTIVLPKQFPIDQFLMPEKVNQFVGIYADDERTPLFSALLPKAENDSKTQIYTFKVPGSHETLVGNRWTHGHSSYAGTGLSDIANLIPEIVDDRVRAVGWVTKVFVKELLGTHNWGSVRFNKDTVDAEEFWEWEPDQVLVADHVVLKEQFLAKITYMHTFGNFDEMRNFSFAQPILGWEYFTRGLLQEPLVLPSPLPWPANINQRPVEQPYSRRECVPFYCWYHWVYGWYGDNEVLPNHISDGLEQYEFLWQQGGMRGRYVEPSPSPIAEAGPDQTITFWEGNTASVTLDGGDSEPGIDCMITGYAWQEQVNTEVCFFPGFCWTIPISKSIGFGETLTVELLEGIHDINLTATNDYGQSHSDTVRITISPYINQPPTADAGEDMQIMSCREGKSIVTLDGSGSVDPDNSNLTYTWSLEGTVIAQGMTPAVELAEGIHDIDLVVSDGEAESDPDSVTIEIEETPVGDLNCDMCVSRADYYEIISVVRARLPYNPVYDLNNDGAVNVADARYLTTRFSVPRGAPCQ